MTSPTARTLNMLREDGWTCDVVERWIPGAMIRKDFLGLLDIIAIRRDQTLGVQCTSGSNLSARIKKLSESPNLSKLRMAGWRIEAWGWRKTRDGWGAKVVDIS